jgi:5-methylcytosine-specific restriction enzyme B
LNLKDDKRGVLPVTLPYSKEQFSVPENLYIIATMNTADRSIALMDVALRRRFTFIEMMPRPDLLKGIVVESESPSVELDKLLTSLNKEITHHLDRDHQIGHSYFMKIASADEDERIEQLEFVWNYQIMPLLEEYFYSQPDKLRQILSPFVTSIEAGNDSVDGFIPVGRAQGEDLIDSLGRLAGKS